MTKTISKLSLYAIAAMLLLAHVSSDASEAADTPRTYLVAFSEPALLEQNPDALKLGTQAKAAQSALAKASTVQDTHLNSAAKALKLDLTPSYRYLWTNNAVALELTPKAALNLRSQPGIASVEEEFVGFGQTDYSPTFIGAQALWTSTAARSGNRGAGVVVGIIDSGINTEHPSFAARASDGYVHQNPRGLLRYGLCSTTASARCSDKLIGLYDFTDEGNKDASDLDGHGTHVASTAIGNPFVGSAIPLAISGIAPRANVIAYKACVKTSSGRTSCPGTALLAAIEQATADRVQVINYSIGGNERDPYAALNGATDIRAMFNARAAGVVVVVSAGNDGPGPGSITSPSNAPWVLSVANISHGRLLQTSLSGLTGATAPPQLSFDGAGLTGALPERAIVLGERFGSALCGTGEDSADPPTGQSNPFAPGTFNGQIVVCERGQQARVAKSFNLRAAGAGGMILVNTALEGESTVADLHYLPTVHLGQADGEKLRAWLRSSSTARGRIIGTVAKIAPASADVLASSSSRGPAGVGVLKPDIAAPGSNVLAADLGNSVRPLTGTSMSAPHVTGSAALLRGLHPSWGVDEVESALRGSALNGVVRDPGGVNLADPYLSGSGRLQVNQADRALLYFPLSNNDLRQGATNPSGINLPSLVLDNCVARCTFARTVKASTDLPGRANFSARLLNAPAGLSLAMRPAQFNLGAGESQVIAFDIDVSNPLIAGQVLSSTVEISSSETSVAPVRLPLRVQAAPGNVPDEIALTANAERGQLSTNLSGLIALPRPAAAVTDFVKISSETAAVSADTTASDPFDDGGTLYRSVNISSAGGQFWANISNANGRDFDLYLGRDLNGDGKAALSETLCRRDSSASVENCRINVTAAGTYWLLVQNTSGSTLPESVSMQFAAIPNFSLNPNIAIMPGRVSAAAAFPLNFSYRLPGSSSGETYVGLLALRADAAASAPMSTTLLRLTRTDGEEQPIVLFADRAESIALAPNQSRRRIGFSVPFGASQVTLSGTSAGAINAEIVRAPANEANFTSAPVAAALVSAQFFGGTANIALSGSALTPGRYYLTLSNAGSTAASANLRLSIASGANAELAPELYYNPGRSGHGLIMTRARNDAQVIWYTYDQLGQPTWYWFFADGYFTNKPKVVSGPLYRYTWDGSQASAGQIVGNASITSTGTDQFIWDFNLLGQSGSEPMLLLGKSACVSAATFPVATDYTGAWYQPARSGWGASVHVAASIEFTNFFVFDALGQPRWALGSVDLPRALAANPETVPVYQHFGFCPTCSFIANTRRPVGSYRFKLDSTPRLTADLTATVQLTLNYLTPLSGNFDQSGDFALLTGKKSCVP
jgi:subtilisin family serine protease